jgi:hypothetical protein
MLYLISTEFITWLGEFLNHYVLFGVMFLLCAYSTQNQAISKDLPFKLYLIQSKIHYFDKSTVTNILFHGSLSRSL